MDAQTFNLADFLPYRLAVLSARISKRLSVVYEEGFGLTMPEWRVIVHLARCEKVSVREIHNCVNLEKPRVSRAVAKLEKAGLVRKQTSEADHRLVEISLTDAGRKVLNAIVPEALRFEARLMQAFSAAEAKQLDVLMERLHGELDEDPRATPRSSMDTA